MNEKMVTRLEHKLKQITTERDQLNEQNHKLKGQVEHLQNMVTRLENILHQHPLKDTQNINHPLSQEGKISKLQEIIRGKEYQIDFLSSARQDQSFQLTSLQTKTQQLSNLLDEKTHDLEIAHLKLQSHQKNEHSFDDMVEDLNRRLASSHEDKINLIEEKGKIVEDLQKEREIHREKLMELVDNLKPIQEFISNPQSCQIQPKNTTAEESVLLKIQQEELQNRNDQIHRLRTILGGNPIPSQESHLKNTIKHLRGELGRYNNMMKQLLQRSVFAQSTIQNFQSVTNKYQQEITMLNELKEQNNALQNQIEIVKLELELVKDDLAAQKKNARDTKAILMNTLVENQHYHEMMYDNHSSNFNYYISIKRQEFLERAKERSKKQKWSSIEQLIDVNQKLRRRLKIA